jgi:hypothetical protein
MIQATKEPKVPAPALHMEKPDQSDVKLFERILKAEGNAENIKHRYDNINSGTKESSGPFDSTYRHLSLTERLRQEELLKEYKKATTEAKQLRKSLTPGQEQRFFEFTSDRKEYLDSGTGWLFAMIAFMFAPFVLWMWMPIALVIAITVVITFGCFFLESKAGDRAEKAFKAKWYPNSELPDNL